MTMNLEENYDMLENRLKSEKAFAEPTEIRGEDKLLGLLNNLLNITSEINEILDGATLEKYDKHNRLRTDIVHFLEIERNNLSKFDLIEAMIRYDKITTERRTNKNILHSKDSLEFIPELKKTLEYVIPQVDNNLSDKNKSYAVREAESLDFFTTLQEKSSETKMEGQYTTSFLKRSLKNETKLKEAEAKKEEKAKKEAEAIEFKRPAVLPPTSFGHSTLADVKEPIKKKNVVNIPQKITADNVKDIVNVVSKVSDKVEKSDTEENRSLTTRSVKKAIKSIKHSNNRQRKKRRR